MIGIDRDWLDAHPLPTHAQDTDKNARGRILVVGGARFVPGALRLTGEAALRSGAGKLQLATVADAAMALGVLVPEAAMIALPVDGDGEIGQSAVPVLTDALARCDALVLGPGMSSDAGELVDALTLMPRDELTILLDAAAITACKTLQANLLSHKSRVILTPHHGEMASLTGADIEDVRRDTKRIACRTADEFGAVVILKSDTTVVASPGQPAMLYDGGGIGLATGGSGDVLAGIAGGLAARGADPLTAAVWAVWLHGEAGKALAHSIGPIGFLARELVPLIPRLMAESETSGRTTRNDGGRGKD
jgi:ADP-dependent NAD(P)H-hydrate dehydratase